MTGEEYMLYKAAMGSVIEKLSELQGEEIFSDCTIICGDREWQVHQFALALHSTVLEAACTDAFEEGKQPVINLSEDDPNSIEALVHYVYDLNYEFILIKTESDHLSLHVQMCRLGEKYDMPYLQDLAIESFKALINNSPPTGSELASAAICAYEETAATARIKKMIVSWAVDNYRVPYPEEPTNEFEKAVQSIPALCRDIMDALLDRLMPSVFRCPAKCRQNVRISINLEDFDKLLACGGCGNSFYGYQWFRYAVRNN